MDKLGIFHAKPDIYVARSTSVGTTKLVGALQ